jgi:hypothetical protein
VITSNEYFIGQAIIGQVASTVIGVPKEYQRHNKVFSKEESQHLPQHTIWDHAIKLLLGALMTLPGRLLLLTQEEIEEAQKFVKEHLAQNTI